MLHLKIKVSSPLRGKIYVKIVCVRFVKICYCYSSIRNAILRRIGSLDEIRRRSNSRDNVPEGCLN